MRKAKQELAHSKDCPRQIDANAQLAEDSEVNICPWACCSKEENRSCHWGSLGCEMNTKHFMARSQTQDFNRRCLCPTPFGLRICVEQRMQIGETKWCINVSGSILRSPGSPCLWTVFPSSFQHQRPIFMSRNGWLWTNLKLLLRQENQRMPLGPCPTHDAAGILWKPRLNESKTSRLTEECVQSFGRSAWRFCSFGFVPSDCQTTIVSPSVALPLCMQKFKS